MLSGDLQVAGVIYGREDRKRPRVNLRQFWPQSRPLMGLGAWDTIILCHGSYGWHHGTSVPAPGSVSRVAHGAIISKAGHHCVPVFHTLISDHYAVSNQQYRDMECATSATHLRTPSRKCLALGSVKLQAKVQSSGVTSTAETRPDNFTTF